MFLLGTKSFLDYIVKLQAKKKEKKWHRLEEIIIENEWYFSWNKIIHIPILYSSEINCLKALNLKCHPSRIISLSP